MDLFHKLIDLVDKNAERIPEGDYVEMCNIIKNIREKMKPPPFLDNQMSNEEEYPGLNQFIQELHEEWYRTDDDDENLSDEAIDQLREHIEQHGIPQSLTINFVR